MVESRVGGRQGEDSHGFIARGGGEDSAPIDFIVQTLHAGGQLQQAQSNRGLRESIPKETSQCYGHFPLPPMSPRAPQDLRTTSREVFF